jgi:predicted RNA-binding protein with PUA-like domain
MNYWLIKSEWDCYSIDDLKKDKSTAWTGVRNYQARNFIRSMKKGDLIIYYHSGGTAPAAVGIAKVVKAPYTEKDPLWSAADVAYVKKFKNPLTLAQIKHESKLKGMLVTQQGSRLSVQPVSKEHFETIQKLGEK